MPDAGSVWYSGSRKSGNQWRKAVTLFAHKNGRAHF